MPRGLASEPPLFVIAARRASDSATSGFRSVPGVRSWADHANTQQHYRPNLQFFQCS
ncbi:hypothetical protein BJX63DRAFT_387623 [Aspergillus granulosus]|uniref:Uncharacterized protein n=1 Tax=Aspergillus granulosus TaxID=176169 RepID=A0ABR4HMZ0_9EURO